MRIAIIGSGNVGTALGAAATKASRTSPSPPPRPRAPERPPARWAPRRPTAMRTQSVTQRSSCWRCPVWRSAASPTSWAVASTARSSSTRPTRSTRPSTTSSRPVGPPRRLQDKVPNAKVVKAFNTIFAGRHGNPFEGEQPLDAFVAGDDADAKAKTGEARDIARLPGHRRGRPAHGSLLEEMAFLNISLNATKGWVWQSGWKLVGPTEAQ